MQKFVLKLAGLGLVLTALFFTSCGDDPVVVNPLGPDITLAPDPGFLSGDSDVIINEGFAVKVRLTTGDAQLNTLEITEGTDKLASNRFTINGGALTSNNPLLIVGADKDGVTYEIDITPSGSELVGDFTTYTFTVTADDGEVASTSLVIATVDLPGTPLTSTITGVLLNQAGPTGTGGLDLDTGASTGSADADAEIRDLGLDCTMNPGTLNWLRQIGTVNGAEMVRIDQAAIEGFDFAAIDKKEPIADAFSTAGITLSDGTSTNCANGAETTVPNSSQVAEGDVFVVFANSNYYMLRVDAVNENNTGNDDSYEFSIKF